VLFLHSPRLDTFCTYSHPYCTSPRKLSQDGHQNGDYPSLLHEATTKISNPPWMECLSTVGLPPSIKFAGTHLYTWVERGSVAVKDVRVNCFCASLLRTQIHAASCMSARARWVTKWVMIGQMAVFTALPGFDDLGPSVTPTFLCRNRIVFKLISTLSKNEQNINLGS